MTGGRGETYQFSPIFHMRSCFENSNGVVLPEKAVELLLFRESAM